MSIDRRTSKTKTKKGLTPKRQAKQQERQKQMQQVKSKQLAAPETATTSQTQEQKAQDPAAEAGLPKNRFYQTDKWVIGKDGAQTYVVPKNTLPEPLSKAFMRSTKPDPVTDKIRFDESKFELDEWPDSEFKGGRVAIGLWSPPMSFANVTFDKDTFVISIAELPESGVFPFNKDEFLKAVHAAKWHLELYAMPSAYSDSEPESESEKP